MRNYETKTIDYIDKKTGAHVVKAMTMYAGKTVSAFSKCDPNDHFDLEFGKKVACKRLDAKIAKKRAASMTAYSKICDDTIKFLEQEIRRMRKAKERADISVLDRKIEVKDIEAELADMLVSIN
jgi:hypothetical protein